MDHRAAVANGNCGMASGGMDYEVQTMSSEKQYGRDIADRFFSHISADEMRVCGHRLIGQLCVEGFCERLMELAWQPPEFLKPGWLVMDANGKWFWNLDKPELCNDIEWSSNFNFLRLEFVNWTPPRCTDWKQSRREIRGKS